MGVLSEVRDAQCHEISEVMFSGYHMVPRMNFGVVS